MKRCSKCKKEKSLADFSRNKNSKDGLAWECKQCGFEYRKPLRANINERSREYRANNREKTNAAGREYYHATHERQLARKKAYRLNHPEIQKAYQATHRDHIRESHKQWRQKQSDNLVYKEKQRLKTRKTRAAKPDKYRAMHHKYRPGSVGVFTGDQWAELKDRYNNRCLRCGSSEQICVDHIVPISKGGVNTIDNIQPLCKRCNTAKGNRSWDFRPNFIDSQKHDSPISAIR